MRKRSIFPALFLILLGLWFLAGNLELGPAALFDWGRIWPIFIIFGGLSGLWSYASRQNQDPDQLFWGVAAVGIGCFFFLFTLELRLPIFGRVQWGRMGELWPGFIVIVGVALLAEFLLSGFRKWDTLLLGIGALVVGLVAFAFTINLLGPATARQLVSFWPAILIVIGLGILGRSFFGRR